MAKIDCVMDGSARCAAVSLGSFIDQSGRNVPQEVLRCETCGHGITMPPIADIGSLYAGRTTQDFHPHDKRLTRSIKDVAFHIQVRRLLRQIGDKPASLLDYGCGSGQFTRILGSHLPGSIVTGSDFFDTPPPELKGGRYVGFSELEKNHGGFDMVLALHVLEHDNSPREFIRKLMRLVPPGGRLVIEVPNIDCPWGRILGKYWDVWYLPFHRHHFNRASLRAVLEGEGLLVESLSGVTVPSMNRTFANLFGLPKGVFCLLVGIALHPIQILGEWISGQPTAIRVVARKPRP